MSSGTQKAVKKACVACGQEFSGEMTNCPEDGTQLTPLTQEAQIGSILADKYEIIDVIGGGAMGLVYKAKHLLMKRSVAIKMLHPNAVASSTTLQRFQQEAEAASCLNHPNILTVFDFGVTAQGQPYLVMDYLEGTNLSTLIEKETYIQFRRALGIFLQMAAALQHAHSKGVIHRDLKPSNIMLVKFEGDEDFVKIVDFGIAKVLNRDTSSDEPDSSGNLTRTGEIFGSPLYMSPEQCRGRKLDARSDIYSMGCVMYRVLTGKPPLVGIDLLECMYKHVNEMPAPFCEACPDFNIPPDFEAVIFKALAKDPDDRYQQMSELRQALDVFNQSLTHRVRAYETVEVDFKPPAQKETRKVQVTTGTKALLPPDDDSDSSAPQDSNQGAQNATQSAPPAQNASGALSAMSNFGDTKDSQSFSNAQGNALEATTQGSSQTPAQETPSPGIAAGAKAIDIKVWIAIGVVLLALPVVAMMMGGKKDSKDNPPIVGTATGFDHTSSPPAASGSLMDQGLHAYKNGNFADAEKFFSDAAKEAKEKHDAKQQAIAINQLVKAYYADGKYGEAGKEAKELIAVLVNAKDKSSPIYAEALCNQAYVYMAERDFGKALPLLEESLKIRKTLTGPEHGDDAADSLSGLAEIASIQGQYKKAIDYETEAVSLRKKYAKPSDPELADELNKLAQAYEYDGIKSHKVSHLKASELLYREALKIYQDSLGPEDPKVAKNLMYIGTLQFQQGKNAQAEALFTQAIDMRKKASGVKPDPTVAECMVALSMLYVEEKKFSLARETFNKAIEIRKSANGPDDPMIAKWQRSFNSALSGFGK